MTSSPRIPYGLARKIVSMMQPGQTLYVRPQYVVQFHNAARRLGVKLRAVAFRRDGRAMFKMKLRQQGEPSGHKFCRLAKVDSKTGRWVKDREAVA